MFDKNPSSKEYRKMVEEQLALLKSKHPLAMNFYDDYKPSRVSHPHLPPRSRSQMSLDPKTGILTDKEIAHLMRRTRFGVRRDELDDFRGKDLDEIMDMMLVETEIDPPVNQYGALIEDPDTALGETFVDIGYTTDDTEGARVLSLKLWIQDHLINDRLTLQSSMWLFWQNHLVTELYGVFYSYGTYRYLSLLRDLSMGNFQEMMERITIDANMLIYLNGASNHKWAPDENYARELQELFCVGKGEGSQFIESDVRAAARVLTGYTINDYGEDPYFNASWHDEDDKQFSAFYGNKEIKGRTGEEGAEEYKELIQMIFDTDEVAKFICRKLYIYFVYAEIDEWTEENIIGPLATTFRTQNYEIKPVLRQLLQSEHFFDELNFGAIIKNPLDFIYPFHFNTDLPHKKEDPTEDFQYKASIFWRTAGLGMQLGDPPNVAGWPAYYQTPNFDKGWITTDTITNRIRLSDALVYWGFWTEYGKESLDFLEFTASLENPQDPNALIYEMCYLFLGIIPPQETLDSLKSILLSGQSSDGYWTGAWLTYISDPENEELRNIVMYRLLSLYQRIFQLGEFQLK